MPAIADRYGLKTIDLKSSDLKASHEVKANGHTVTAPRASANL
jgi:hypothetical protein